MLSMVTAAMAFLQVSLPVVFHSGEAAGVVIPAHDDANVAGRQGKRLQDAASCGATLIRADDSAVGATVEKPLPTQFLRVSVRRRRRSPVH
jgi:hypothetical protein